MGYSTGRKPWRSEPPASPETEEMLGSRTKLFYFGLMVIVVFGILTLQLIQLQLVRGDEFLQRAATNALRVEPILPTRGLVYDRNGLPLVDNRPGFAAAVVAADVPEERQTEIAIALQEITGVPAGEIEADIEAKRASNDPFSPAIVKDHIPAAMAFAIRERLSQMPGVRVLIEPRRQYLEGALFSHVLGFVGRINPEEYKELSEEGYQLNDYVGKTGVELTYEDHLRGEVGHREVEVDASGRELRVISETPAKPGENIVLSIDAELQRKTTELLQAGMGQSRNGAAVVMNVKTGEILSLVSLPLFDNNIFSGEVDEVALKRIHDDPGKPMVNHVLSEMYPPGSTFKMVTGLAALQDGIATPSTQITSLGSISVPNQYNPSIVYIFRDWSALGTLDFYRGVAMSSDVYFYYLAGGYSERGRDLFQGLGATRLADWSKRFGLGDKTGIDLPGESEGHVPDPEWKEAAYGEIWTIGDTYNFGIGQGFLTATPLQMAVVTAAVANGGNVVIPHVVTALKDSEGNTIPIKRENVARNLNIDRRNIDVMREAMRQTVDNGTATTAKARSTTVAGKTGTAEFGPQRPDGSYLEHGWFTGFAPYNDPEIAVSVFLELGNGAGTAAPVAGKILEYYFSRNLAQGRP